jgi:hypothetical protein
MKRWILKTVANSLQFHQVIAMRIVRWAGVDFIPPAGSEERFLAYVPADPRITPLVMMAAWKSDFDSLKRQAELNACMESLRQCEVLLSASQQMLGELSVQYGIPEAFVRMTANHVLLGMNLERSLSR